MSPFLRLLSGSALGLGVLASSTALDSPAFHPEEGVELTKTFETRVELNLDDLSLTADGQDVGEMMGDIEMTLTHESSVTVSDEYRSLGEGRPAELLRTFDELESRMAFSAMSQFGGDDQEVPGSSELEGTSVLFTWNEDEEEYEPAFEDGGGDTDLLEGLEEDMDLRALLPDGEVEEGDSWEIELRELESVFAPGGELSITPEDADEGEQEIFEEIFGDGLENALEELLDGSCTATYKGTYEVDEIEVGEIQMALEISSTADLSELLQRIAESIGEQQDVEMPEFVIDLADLSLDFEGEGVLLWNLEDGLLHSFEISGSGDIAFDLSIGVDVEGESHSADVSLELSGSWNQSVTAE
jgi:hypothetical protein